MRAGRGGGQDPRAQMHSVTKGNGFSAGIRTERHREGRPKRRAAVGGRYLKKGTAVPNLKILKKNKGGRGKAEEEVGISDGRVGGGPEGKAGFNSF